jgi:hypothetical protein
MEGEPPANASSEELASYARGVAKLARREAEYFRAKDRYIGRHGNQDNFGNEWQLRTLKEREASMNPQVIAVMEQHIANPEANKIFEQKYGFNLNQARREQAELEDILYGN